MSSLRGDVLRYALVGVVNTLVGFSIIIGLEQGLKLNPFLANAGGYAAGICISFVLSQLFVFRARSTARRSAPRYALAVAAAFGLNQGVLALARWLTPDAALWAVCAQGAATGSYTVALFLLSRYWVFAPAPAREA
ncbi:GtrA family protein [Caulobacter sp.]|uniref:GtrA family protein n=1 Tax=Caulobacter sp. TaxID=78 RepID=UPI003BAC9183